MIDVVKRFKELAWFYAAMLVFSITYNVINHGFDLRSIVIIFIWTFLLYVGSVYISYNLSNDQNE